MKSLWSFTLLFTAACFAWYCGGPGARPAAPAAEGSRMRVPGLGAYGIFDPSFAPDPGGGVWAVVSSVDPSYRWPVEHPHTVSTALIFSRNGDRNWKYIARVNSAPDVMKQKKFAGVGVSAPFNWSHETPTLVYDLRAEANARWKLFWHRYAHIKGKRRFEYGWIGYKAAGAPEELAGARETKLFAARGYKKTADVVGGAPELLMKGLTPALRDCIALTEPSALVRENTLYLAMFCATGRNSGRIILLREREGHWSFAGTFLENRSQAKKLSRRYPAFEGFSAPELAVRDNGLFLIVTPTRPGSFPEYRGCMVMPIANLDTARLRRRGAAPEVVTFISDGEGHHRGACAYNEKVRGGIFISRAYIRAPVVFRIFSVGTEL